MKNSEKREVNKALAMFLQVSISMIVPIIMCTLAGLFIGKATDNKLVIIGGILIGIVAGFNGVYRQLKRYIKDEDNKKA